MYFLQADCDLLKLQVPTFCLQFGKHNASIGSDVPAILLQWNVHMFMGFTAYHIIMIDMHTPVDNCFLFLIYLKTVSYKKPCLCDIYQCLMSR